MSYDSLQHQYNTRLEAEIREYERRKQEERDRKKHCEKQDASDNSDGKSK